MKSGYLREVLLREERLLTRSSPVRRAVTHEKLSCAKNGYSREVVLREEHGDVTDDCDHDAGTEDGEGVGAPHPRQRHLGTWQLLLGT